MYDIDFTCSHPVLQFVPVSLLRHWKYKDINLSLPPENFNRHIMALQCGIVGLPNVGKSTLFNALTAAKALSANYPFATKDPNVGIITVPDKRLDKLEELVQPQRVVPTTVEIVDIAGLIKGASQGEDGLKPIGSPKRDRPGDRPWSGLAVTGPLRLELLPMASLKVFMW